jgi:hypothetical protein
MHVDVAPCGGSNPQQAGIGWCLVIGILDQYSQFATDALQAHRHRQSQEIYPVHS